MGARAWKMFPGLPPRPAVRRILCSVPRRPQPLPPSAMVRRGTFPLALRGRDARAPLALVLSLVQELRPARRQGRGTEQPPLTPKYPCKVLCELEQQLSFAGEALRPLPLLRRLRLF